MPHESLPPGVVDLLVHCDSDETALIWILTYLAFRKTDEVRSRPPSVEEASKALDTVGDLVADGLIEIGHIDYEDPDTTRRLAPTVHVAEPLAVVRTRVLAHLASDDPSGWQWLCWIVTTQAGSAIARHALDDDEYSSSLDSEAEITTIHAVRRSPDLSQ